MKQSSALPTLSRWTSFSAATLGSVALLFATPQLEPDGVIEISEFIQMEIFHDTMMGGSDVSVDIKDGIGTLTGSVSSLAQAERAAAKALTSPEVLTVVNQIRVSPREEAEILSKAKNLLASQEVIDVSRIRVSVSGSRLILEGAAGSIDEGELRSRNYFRSKWSHRSR